MSCARSIVVCAGIVIYIYCILIRVVVVVVDWCHNWLPNSLSTVYEVLVIVVGMMLRIVRYYYSIAEGGNDNDDDD